MRTARWQGFVRVQDIRVEAVKLWASETVTPIPPYVRSLCARPQVSRAYGCESYQRVNGIPCDQLCQFARWT